MCPQRSSEKNVLLILVFPHYATVDPGRKVLLLLREAGMIGELLHDAVYY